MREHTAREQALFDVRMGVVRRWAERTEGAEETQRLFARAHIDTRARLALRRQDLFYRAVLVEPSGDVPHHILDNVVWGYFRDEMRISPALFYALATEQWEGLIGTTSPTDWRRAVYNSTTGKIDPSLVSDTEVPGDYDNMPAKTIMEFLNASGGRVVPLDEIPDPYPPLSMDDVALTARVGSTVVRHTLESLGGKPPLVYALVDQIGSFNTVVTRDMLAVQITGATAGEYTGKVKVTDALGATAEATVTLTLTTE